MKSARFLTLILMLFCLKAFSQETESTNYTKFVGGYLSLSAGKGAGVYYPYVGFPATSGYYYSVGNGFDFSIQPTIGKQINAKTFIGFSPYLSLAKGKDEDYKEVESSSNTLGLYLFTRHSIKTAGRLSFLLSPSISFSQANYKGTTFISSINNLVTTYTKFNRLNVAVSPMLTYKLTPRFRLISNIGSIGYYYGGIKQKSTISDWGDTETKSQFNANFNLQNFSFGAEYLF